MPRERASSTRERWAAAPSGPASANPSLSTTRLATPLCAAGGDHGGDLGRRHGDHGQVDRIGDGVEVGVGPHAGDRRRRAVDRVDGAGEPGPQQVAEHLVPDPQGLAPGADHGDRGGFEQPADRRRGGLAFTLVHRLDRRRRRLDGERDPHDTAPERPLVPEAGGPEDIQHPAVLGQGLGDEAGDAPIGGDRGQVLEQDRPEPAALVGVVDGEGHLGLAAVVVEHVVAGDGHDVRRRARRPGPSGRRSRR